MPRCCPSESSSAPFLWRFAERLRGFAVLATLIAISVVGAVACSPTTVTVTTVPSQRPSSATTPRPSSTPVTVTAVRALSPVTDLQEVGERTVVTPSLITAIAVSRDARVVVTGHVDNTIRVWDGRTLEGVDVIGGLPGIPWSMSIGNGDRTVAVTTRSDLRTEARGRLLLVDLQARSVVEVDPDAGRAGAVAIAPHAPVMAATYHFRLNVYDIDDLIVVATLGISGEMTQEVAVNATGDQLLLNSGGASGGSVRLLALSGGELTRVGSERGGLPNGSATAFSPTGDRVAFGYTVRDMSLSPVQGAFNVSDVSCYPSGLRFQGADAASFSHDGRMIAHLISVGGGRSANLLDIRDLATGRSLWCSWLPEAAGAAPGGFAMRLGGLAGAASEHLFFFSYGDELRRLTFDVR